MKDKTRRGGTQEMENPGVTDPNRKEGHGGQEGTYETPQRREGLCFHSPGEVLGP